jgi:UDP-N-acetylmuramoylalanine--D-glutamate ligase
VLIKSPGVPQHAPVLSAARAAGIPVLGELELGWRLLRNEFIAVTGTNGKTTTTEWIGHIHRVAGAPVAVAGNVGTALTSLVGSVADDATIVCEASSFQLEDAIAFAPEAAVLLNLAPDHLDRHGSFEAYAAAKLRIFANQRAGDLAVLAEGGGAEPATGARVIRYGTGPEAELAGEIALPGEHNSANGMAAAAVCLERGLPRDAVAEGLRTFAGVAHRLERIRELGGVAYVNDSKATNVASAIVALRSFAGGVHLIAGGRGKNEDFSGLAPLVAERCVEVRLIGETADELEHVLRSTGVAIHVDGELERAVSAAAAAARSGDTVLLSPACTSYDQYANFEARGDHFRELVEELR